MDIWGATTAPTVLLTTPVAARGLDFTNLTHVYSLGVLGRASGGSQAPGGGGGGGGGFMDERAEYAHQAGRLGRLGNRCPGVVTSIVDDGGTGAAAVRAVVQAVAGPSAEVREVGPEEWAAVAGAGAGPGGGQSAVQRLNELFDLYDGEDGGEDSGEDGGEDGSEDGGGSPRPRTNA